MSVFIPGVLINCGISRLFSAIFTKSSKKKTNFDSRIDTALMELWRVPLISVSCLVYGGPKILTWTVARKHFSGQSMIKSLVRD